MTIKTRIVSLILTTLLLTMCNNPFIDTLLPKEPEEPTPLFTVSIKSPVGGKIVVAPQEAVDVGIEAGTPITLTVTPNAGYTLEAVSLRIEREDSSEDFILNKPYTFSMFDSDVTVRATFTPPAPPPEPPDNLFSYDENLDGTYIYSMRRILDENIDDTFQFPYGEDDESTSMDHSYWLGDTELSFTLWQVVRDWAKANSYTFANDGVSGGGDIQGEAGTHPVSSISWYDALVWCNALTEWYNEKYETELEPVYQSEDDVLRDAADTAALDEVQPKDGANGFRLPTSAEWELAARWRKDAINSVPGFMNTEPYTSYFTTGQYASGVNRADGADIGQVAVYNTTGTAPVKSKRPNDLGIYDMSGNVAEMCFDSYPDQDSSRIVKGQAWSDTDLGVGLAVEMEEPADTIGFRVARTSVAEADA